MRWKSIWKSKQSCSAQRQKNIIKNLEENSKPISDLTGFFFFQILGFDNLFTFTNWRSLVRWHWKISKLTFLNQRQKTKSWKFVKFKTQNQFLIWRCFWEIVYKLIWHCKYYFILTGNSIHKIITTSSVKKIWIWIRFSGFEFFVFVYFEICSWTEQFVLIQFTREINSKNQNKHSQTSVHRQKSWNIQN